MSFASPPTNVGPSDSGSHRSSDDRNEILKCYDIVLAEFAKIIPESEEEKDKLVAQYGLDPKVVRSPEFALAIGRGMKKMVSNNETNKNLVANVTEATKQAGTTRGTEELLSNITVKDYILEFFNSSPIELLTTMQLLMQPIAMSTQNTSESSREVQMQFSDILQSLAAQASGDDKSGQIAAEVAAVSAAQSAASGALENSTTMLSGCLSALTQMQQTVAQAGQGSFEAIQRAFQSIQQAGRG